MILYDRSNGIASMGKVFQMVRNFFHSPSTHLSNQNNFLRIFYLILSNTKNAAFISPTRGPGAHI